MSATEVTIAQFKKFAIATSYETEAENAAQAALPQSKAKASDRPAPKPDRIQTYLSPGYAVTDDSPAAVITWNDAIGYCNWLSEQERVTYRLPTEAEWEYACRAGTTTQYWFGDDHAELENYEWRTESARSSPHPVGTKLPNAFGLFDMHGSLYEWCQDFWCEKYYEQTELNDPTGPTAGSARVVRGGSWYSYTFFRRSACRSYYTPSIRYINIGFRYVRVLN